MKKCLVISGVGAIGIGGILLMVKTIRHRNNAGMWEKTGKGIDEKLQQSRAALEKASDHLHSVLEYLTNKKS